LSDHDLDSEALRRIMLIASELALPAWEKVELAYARGLTLATAKQSVLDEEVERLAPVTEAVVIERLVQLVMQTPASGLRPVARERHRKAVLKRLMQPYRDAGGAEPGAFALWLYDRFGIVPGPVRAFWQARGERLGRVG
jgi:hypothetical protein